MTIPRSCFVIMPYGTKRGIDFDAVYADLIRRTLHSVKACPGYQIRCKRSDGTDRSGWIHRKMIQDIHRADLALVDLSLLNPNVFYELGVRHALVPSGTILIRRQGTKLPFNLAGFNVITYPKQGPAGPAAQVAAFRAKLRRFACSALTVGGVDSLVHDALDIEILTKSPRIRETRVHEFKLTQRPAKRIGLITGDIVNVKCVDAWVNSENTKMQMSRHVGRSISSVIRYFGAKKDRADHVTNDLIADELQEIMKGRVAVDPASVLDTGPGELRERNGVKRIFHVASVIGQVQYGFHPIPNIGSCVERVLERANSPAMENSGIRSILFPLMGTGSARGSLESTARALIETTIAYLLNNPGSRVERVYFLTATQEQLKVCRQLLQRDRRLEAVEPGTETTDSVEPSGDLPSAGRAGSATGRSSNPPASRGRRGKASKR